LIGNAEAVIVIAIDGYDARVPFSARKQENVNAWDAKDRENTLHAIDAIAAFPARLSCPIKHCWASQEWHPRDPTSYFTSAPSSLTFSTA
jgi:hypothetical protein